MYKFIDKMSNSNGLQGLPLFGNLLGLRAACLQFGQSPCNHNQERHVHPRGGSRGRVQGVRTPP